MVPFKEKEHAKAAIIRQFKITIFWEQILYNKLKSLMKFHDYQCWINFTFFLFLFSDRILALPEVGSRALCKEYLQNPSSTAVSSTWCTYSADDLRVTDILWPFFPNCKQIKQSWLTETKNTGLRSLLRVFDKSSLSPPTLFTCKSPCPEGSGTAHPQTWSPAAPSAAISSYMSDVSY